MTNAPIDDQHAKRIHEHERSLALMEERRRCKERVREIDDELRRMGKSPYYAVKIDGQIMKSAKARLRRAEAAKLYAALQSYSAVAETMGISTTVAAKLVKEYESPETES